MSQHGTNRDKAGAGVQPASQAVRRPLCMVLVAAQLAGCASGGQREFASDSEPQSESSAAGTIASHAGGGALFGAAMTGEMMRDCSGDGCGFVLAVGLLLIPVLAVVGAGVGVAKVAIRNEREEVAAREQEIWSSDACPDPRAAEWLRDCGRTQGAIPPAFLPSPDRSEPVRNPQFQAWFDECGTAVERKFESRTRRLVPEVCRRDPVPTPDRVVCMQKVAAAEQEERLDRALFSAQRSKFEDDAAVGRCSL
jgi:hypothetical protein